MILYFLKGKKKEKHKTKKKLETFCFFLGGGGVPVVMHLYIPPLFSSVRKKRVLSQCQNQSCLQMRVSTQGRGKLEGGGEGKLRKG